jgi:tetratricopeptide (TPR) repeat protein
VLALALVMGLAQALEGAEPAIEAADAAFDRGDQARALELYTEVVEAHPDDAHALVRLGTLLSWKGDFAAAERILDRALVVDPGSEAARRQRAWVLAWDLKLKPAALGFRGLLRENPNDGDALLGLARSLAWSGRFRESAGACQRVVDLEPTSLDGRTCQAYAESLLGRHSEARSAYGEVLAIDPSNRDARLGLSRLDLWSGRSEDAFARVLDLKSEHPLDADVDEMLFRLRQVRTLRARAAYDGSADEAHNSLDVLRAEVTAPLPRSSDVTVGAARSSLSDPFRTGQVDSLYATSGVQTGAGQRVGLRLGIDRKQGPAGPAESDLVGGASYVFGLDRRWRGFASVDRSTLVYSPEILAHDIVNDRADVGVSGTVGERFYFVATAAAASVSDGNRYRGLSSAVEYRLPTWSTRATVGYRLRLEDYAEHAGHGYFDPSHFVSHLAFADLRDTFWRRRAYYGLHIEAGIQSFDYAGMRVTNDHVLQWDAALGIPVGERLYLEGYGSWSNYVLKSPTGFRSRRFGVRLVRQLHW